MSKKARLWIFRVISCLAFLTGYLLPSTSVFAAMCSGNSCTGLYADSTCTASAGSTAFTIYSAYVEPRQSTVCKAQWTRVTNKASSTRWTAGSTRYGGLYYNSYHQSVQSGGEIATNQAVYTPMVGNDGGVGVISTVGCGEINTSQMTLPIGGTRPDLSIYCSDVW